MSVEYKQQTRLESIGTRTLFYENKISKKGYTMTLTVMTDLDEKEPRSYPFCYEKEIEPLTDINLISISLEEKLKQIENETISLNPKDYRESEKA